MKPFTQLVRQIAVNQVYWTNWYQTRRRRKTIGETGTQDRTPEEAARITLEIFEKYCREAEWSPADIPGKSILEIGPGELFGATILFAAQGARRAVGIDRFEEFRDTDRTRAILRALRAVAPPAALERWDTFVDPEGRARLDAPGLEYVHGVEFERNHGHLIPPFDLIASNAVLEHVANVDACFAEQARLLAPGGKAVHQVDLRSHDSHEKYPLEFLEYPDTLWSLMTNKMDGPNRLRFSDYPALASRYGFGLIRMSRVLEMSAGEAEGYRPRLHRRFRRLSNADLAVQGILFCMQKIA